MSPTTMLDELIGWLRDLPPDFAFLLALPVIVVIAGVAAGLWRERRAVSRPGAPRPASKAGPSPRGRRRPASSAS